MSCGNSVLTPEIQAKIGLLGERTKCWGVIDREGLRRFSQALMDPDPRYWAAEFAASTKFGRVITPPIYPSYMDRSPPWGDDVVSESFKNNINSDGMGGFPNRSGLPPIKTSLKRILNGGNEIEVYEYAALGDEIYFQSKYAGIIERESKKGDHLLIVTVETTYTNQRNQVLCVTRQALIHR